MKPLAGAVDIIDIGNQAASVGSVIVAQLIVRNLDGELVKALKIRAARHGRSAEAEHREILRHVLSTERQTKSLRDFLLEMPNVGRDEDFERTQDFGRETNL